MPALYRRLKAHDPDKTQCRRVAQRVNLEKWVCVLAGKMGICRKKGRGAQHTVAAARDHSFTATARSRIDELPRFVIVEVI